MGSKIVRLATTAIGGVMGAALGYWIFQKFLENGFYLLLLPGVLIGLGVKIGAGRTGVSWSRGIITGVCTVLFGFFLEWHFMPFAKDDSLDFFIRHVQALGFVSYLMIFGGGLFAFWNALGSLNEQEGMQLPIRSDSERRVRPP